MLYSILFGSFIYLNNAQLPTLTEYACTDDSGCTSLSGYAGFLPGGASGESFTCSTSMGYCTITCSNGDAACTTVNGLGLGVENSACTTEDSVDKCVVDLSCQSRADCTEPLLPRCDTSTGKCIEETPQPTDDPTTAEPSSNPTTAAPNATPKPTDAPTTPEPTDAPTTMADRIAACIAACPTSADDEAMFCEADETYDLSSWSLDDFVLKIDCVDVANKCQAECVADIYYEYYTKDLDSNVIGFIEAAYGEPVDEFCKVGDCINGTPAPDPDDTPAPTINVTPLPTTTETQDCIDACDPDDNPMYCIADVEIQDYEITIPCTDVGNACEAQCLVDGAKATLTDGMTDQEKLQVEAGLNFYYPEGLVETFCFPGTCDGTPEPQTTDPCNDPYYDVTAGWTADDDCPGETGDGCGVQFNVTLDFCILNRKFFMREVWGYAKLAYMYVINEITSYEGYCKIDEIKIQRYRPGYKTDDAKKRGKKKPTRKRTSSNSDECDAFDIDDWADDDCCEDIDAICGGADRRNMEFTLEIDTAFYCGECTTMRKIVTELVDALDEVDIKFALECLGVSVEGDTVCSSGFGGVTMEIEEAVLAYVDEDGDTEIIVSVGSEAGANEIKYGLALIFAFIMVAIH